MAIVDLLQSLHFNALTMPARRFTALWRTCADVAAQAGCSMFLASGLAACSWLGSEQVHLPPSNPPGDKAFQLGVRTVLAAAKLTGTPEVSGIRHAPPSAPGDWMACLRSVGASPVPPYALFFNGDAMMDYRLAIMMDECEKATYAPLKK